MKAVDWSVHLRHARQQSGLSQMELARLSGISLPTIQNLESGKGNPALSTLESLFGILGFTFKIEPLFTDWEALAICGAPLLTLKNRKFSPSADLLIHQLKLACRDLLAGPAAGFEEADFARKKDAIQSVLLALVSHYPKFFTTRLLKNQEVNRIFPKNISGRLIKLKRQAYAVLSTYL